jgi:hypothetical protein
METKITKLQCGEKTTVTKDQAIQLVGIDSYETLLRSGSVSVDDVELFVGEAIKGEF